MLNTSRKRAAACAWLDNHKLSEAWNLVSAGYRMKDGAVYVVLHARNENAEYRHCVNCNGSGHYFKTKKELKYFMWENGYCKNMREEKTA